LKFGEFIRIYRSATGLKQKDVAARITRRGSKSSRKAVSSWESGRSVPDVDVLDNLFHALDLTPKEKAEGFRLAALAKRAA